MYSERLFAFAVAVAFGLLPYTGVKDMPPVVAWIGIFGAGLIAVLTFVPIEPKFVWPISLIISGALCSIAGSVWLYQRVQETPKQVNAVQELQPSSQLEPAQPTIAASIVSPLRIEFEDGNKYERI